MCTFHPRALKRSAAYVQNIVFPYFFLPQLSRNIYPPLLYKANLHPKLLPEPSFHPRQIFFFSLPLVKFSKSDAGAIKERAFSRRLASRKHRKVGSLPFTDTERERVREKERERSERKRQRDEETRFDRGDVFEIEDRDRISMVEARSNYTNRRDAPR